MKKVLLFLSVIIISCSSNDDGTIIIDENTDDIYVLPLVIHLVHSGEEVGVGTNLSKDRILKQIETLNNDYRKRAGTMGYNTHTLGADARIEFKLAEINPNGLQTDGINRINGNDVTIVSNINDLPFDWLPQYGYWNSEKYINVWVLPGPQDLFLGSSQLPYTDLPGLENKLNTIGTGIFLNTLHFGESDIISELNLGRTLTHEMGHFLGLYHLWGEKESANCTEYDDYVEDTPPVEGKNSNCEEDELSCNGELILKSNYMDYVPDACMNMFTNGQVERMRYVLKNSLDRKSLVISDVINRN